MKGFLMIFRQTHRLVFLRKAFYRTECRDPQQVENAQIRHLQQVPALGAHRTLQKREKNCRSRVVEDCKRSLPTETTNQGSQERTETEVGNHRDHVSSLSPPPLWLLAWCFMGLLTVRVKLSATLQLIFWNLFLLLGHLIDN